MSLLDWYWLTTRQLIDWYIIEFSFLVNYSLNYNKTINGQPEYAYLNSSSKHRNIGLGLTWSSSSFHCFRVMQHLNMKEIKKKYTALVFAKFSSHGGSGDALVIILLNKSETEDLNVIAWIWLSKDCKCEQESLFLGITKD